MPPETTNESGVPVPIVVPPRPASDEAAPGQSPFTRGIRADGYRTRPWTMRQYAGFASAEETNQRFRHLLAAGQTGLSTAFDLPTQLGLDSDDPRAAGEVGRTGVAIDSFQDAKRLFDGIPLGGGVSTSMTINAPAALLLVLYQLVGEAQGVAAADLRGTIQNDILKEYAARGNYIFPPRPSMRLTTDTFRYAVARLPRFNPISISGYHMREAGATAVQELAFTLANGIAYVQAAIDSGLEVDRFASRLSFFFNAHNDVFEEIAKFRAARRMWAGIMRERFAARDERSLLLRFHAQTGGSTLTAQQPLVNVVRVALQAFAAVAGGCQSLHTNGYDEALALPTEASATLALRTQQVIAHESGTPLTADPLGGSYYIEYLTDQLETRANALIEEIDRRGGAVAAVEEGFVQQQIEEVAFRHQSAVETGQRIVVGVNRYRDETQVEPALHRGDPDAEQRQVQRTRQLRAQRDQAAADAGVAAVRAAARRSDQNLLDPLRDALAAHCTIGELCEALREEWGLYDTARS